MKNNARLRNGSITSPPQSLAKPIAKKQLSLLKFGNYFSKSPKLTNNRISSNKDSPQKEKDKKEDDNPSNGRIFRNFPGTSSKRQSQSVVEDGNLSNSNSNSHSASAVKRLSDSTPNSNSSDSLEINPIFFPHSTPNSHPLPPLRDHTASINTRYREMIKEYVDNDSTISSSDLQDDLSSVASDGIHPLCLCLFCTLQLHRK